MVAPTCTIIAGPNGAGKTTFAMSYLPVAGECRNFINVDLIASGLSPLDPERETALASRLFLRELRQYVERRESFAFETTLSGRSHLKRIRDLIADCWIVELIYLWISSIELSRNRVDERVMHGGHNIPTEAIVRRYPKSMRNLLNVYAPLCSRTICLDNSTPDPQLIFIESAIGRVVDNEELYNAIQRGASND